MILILTMRRGPHLVLVAGIHIEDSTAPSPTEGDQPSAIDHNFRPGVVEHLGRFHERDGDRIRPTVEGDDAALCNGIDKRSGGAAGRRSVADHSRGAGNILKTGPWRNGARRHHV